METNCLSALRNKIESRDVLPGFGVVYLDNAFGEFASQSGIKDYKTFRAVLGSLTKKGLYENDDYSDNTFGFVKLGE